MQDLFSVAEKVVLVTGGSRGIGRMIAEGFVRGGARVYISARKAEACEATAAELSKLGTRKRQKSAAKKLDPGASATRRKNCPEPPKQPSGLSAISLPMNVKNIPGVSIVAGSCRSVERPENGG